MLDQKSRFPSDMSQREVQNDLSSLIYRTSFMLFKNYVPQKIGTGIHLLLFLFIYILSFSVSGFMELREKSTPWTLEQSI
jgi:hypothetical protein